MGSTNNALSEANIVQIPVEFSGLSVDRMKDNFEQYATTETRSVVLDFTSTEFIDSSGIGAMVFLYKRLEKRSIPMKLLNVNGQPSKLMSLLRVDRTIEFIEQNQMS